MTIIVTIFILCAFKFITDLIPNKLKRKAYEGGMYISAVNSTIFTISAWQISQALGIVVLCVTSIFCILFILANLDA